MGREVTVEDCLSRWSGYGFGRDVLTLGNIIDLRDMVEDYTRMGEMYGSCTGMGKVGMAFGSCTGIDRVLLVGPDIVDTAVSLEVCASVKDVAERIPLIAFDEGKVSFPESAKGLGSRIYTSVLRAFMEWTEIVRIRRG